MSVQITTTRSIEPFSLSVRVEFTEEDLRDAFERRADPDEGLFYAVFSPAWHLKAPSEKLILLARVAVLAEEIAEGLNLTAGVPEPK